MSGTLDNVLGRLGVLRNQVLIFGILGPIVLFTFAKVFSGPSGQIENIGVVLVSFGVAIMSASLVFYFYAYFKLPGSAQERAFELSVQEHATEV